MTELMTTVDNELVPLSDCGWLHYAPCGCIVTAVVAVSGDRVIATEEQAHNWEEPNHRTRERQIRDGYTWRLITMAYYRKHIGAKWECDKHRKVVAS